MEDLSRAFGKLPNNFFEGASGAEHDQSDDQSDIVTNCSNSTYSGNQNQGGDKTCYAEGQLNGTQVHSVRHLVSRVDIDESPGIRGGASVNDSNQNDGFEHLTDEFESLYVRMLRYTANAGREDALPPCTDAWMKLANILQLRNSTLEHEVQDLQDTSASLLEDVKWHVDAMVKLEDALEEAQIERAAAFKEVLDLDAQLSRAQNCAGSAVVPSATPSDGDSTDSNTSEAGSSRSGDHEALKYWTFVQDASGLSRAYRKATGDGRAKSFYFLPRTGLILLENSPRRSYQFPRGFTLHHIHHYLVYHWNEYSSDDPIFRILEILGMRDYLGIRLPDIISNEVIKIGVPDLDTVPGDADDIPLAAWEVFNDTNGGLKVESWQDCTLATGIRIDFWMDYDKDFDDDTDEELPGSSDEAPKPNAGPPDGGDDDGCPVCGYWCVEP
ncbi:hypothetical protein E8E11_010820 [Didymella keratinophila]|nr:hypothetical protein E8E11_010820 [Didymella keratinophila]